MSLSKVKIINKKNKKLPRVLVIRSNKFIYAQVIDDQNGKIIASASSLKMEEKIKPVEKAKNVGLQLAKKIAKDWKEIVFDRNCYSYHGQIKSFAEGLRQGGIKF